MTTPRDPSLEIVLREIDAKRDARRAPSIPTYPVRTCCPGRMATRAEIERYRPRRGLLRWLLGP